LVHEGVVSMKYLVEPTVLFGGDVSTNHVISQPIQPMVEEVVAPMQSLTNPTLLLKSDESTKVIFLMKCSTNPTLLLGSDVSIKHVFIISISIPSEEGDFPLISSMLPTYSRMVSFDWSNIVEPCFPSSTPFQIRVEVNSKKHLSMCSR
jgi:hypothetical protein